MSETKPSNPKDAVGILKAPLSTVPTGPLFRIGAAMNEGARKYGRHNYRDVGVRASVYYDALMRHMMAYWDGEDIDKESGLCHLDKAAACLIVWMDAQINDKLTDDRPPRSENILPTLAEVIKTQAERYPNPKEPHVQVNRQDEQEGADGSSEGGPLPDFCDGGCPGGFDRCCAAGGCLHPQPGNPD